jgi:hypothetical protein
VATPPPPALATTSSMDAPGGGRMFTNTLAAFFIDSAESFDNSLRSFSLLRVFN